MEQVELLLEHYGIAAGLVLIVIGIAVRWGRHGQNTVELQARSGGVVVGRNNSGSISTGNSAGAESKPSRDWIDVSTAIVAIFGAIIAALAWYLPRSPQ